MTTYFISGIATDSRAYDYPMHQIPGSIYLPFPQHDPADTMESYVLKFLPYIDTSSPFNIAANSMGGIMTMELLQHIHPQKVILVSSVKCRAEMPWRLRQLKHSRLHRLLPGRGFIAGVQYGSLFLREINRVPGMRDLVVQMARNNTPDFLYWCVNAIVNWQGKAGYREDIIHLHGTHDKMFPIRNITNAIAVPGGSHSMQLTRKEEITALLLQHLQIS